MPAQQSYDSSRIDQLKTYLKAERYSAGVQRRYPMIARKFLTYIEAHNLAVETVRSEDIERFRRRELRRFCKRYGHAPPNIRTWRWRCAHPVHLLLRLAHGQWPVALEPVNAIEAYHRHVIRGYDTWMRELRGLAPATRSQRIAEAMRFLNALGARSKHDRLTNLSVRDIDAFVRRRSASLRRSSIQVTTGNLRVFLRYLHSSGAASSDLSGTVIGPRMYDYENIPCALPPEDINKVLRVTGKDLSPSGRRDYAMLMLLSTYGLRAGETTALRLEDIDWRQELIRVRHSKTGTYSELPLLRAPGEAILRYLKKGRPKSSHREVFLRACAPYRAFASAKSLYSVVQRRLTAAAVIPPGKRGPHAFRHARAVSLMRAAQPLKIIGDVLGHRSSRSTGVYLKLATKDLRDVGLEVPIGVSS